MEFWQNFCSKILFHVGGYEERVLYSIRNLFFEFQPVYTFSTLTKLSFITFILEQYTMYSQKYTFLHGPLLTNGSYWMQAECANALLCLNVEEILSKCLFLHKKSIRESLLLCIYIIILLWYNFLVLQMQINVIYVVDSLRFIVSPF